MREMTLANSSWTEPRIERLKTLAESMTAQQIAREFGDISRSAVYSKLYQLKRGPLPEIGPWNEPRIEELKQLNAAHLSGSQIADRLGHGITRSAVLGKLFRLHLVSRPIAPRKRGSQTGPSKPRAPPTHSSPPLVPTALPGPFQGPLNITILELTHTTCRWPDDTRPPLYCGRPILTKSSYCPFHDAMSRRVR